MNDIIEAKKAALALDWFVSIEKQIPEKVNHFQGLEKSARGTIYRRSVCGSHYNYKHPAKYGRVTIPKHKGDLKLKTVNSVMRQAGLS